MRIIDTNRLNRTGQKSAKKSGESGEAKFSVPGEAGEASTASSTAETQSVGGIDALLALQAVEDPLFAKKKAIGRANDLLDNLEEIKTDLLVGRVSESRLDNLLSKVTRMRDKAEPGLEEIIDDIELRVRVELAKFNRY